MTAILVSNGISPLTFQSKFTKAQCFRLAKDLFSKLCAYPPSERYDTAQALKHPWITGVGGVNEIPLTRK